MSADPYPEFQPQKVKLAMSVGDKRHYRVREIQPRHFYQTGQKAGLHKEDIDEVSADLSARLDQALRNAGSAAEKAGMPEKTVTPILEGIRSRAASLKAGA